MSAFAKVKRIMGFDDYDSYDEYDEESVFDEYDELEDSIVTPSNKKNNIVNIHTASNMKLVVHEPLNYEDAPGIVDDLKNRKTVVVNLEQLENGIKRKIFDFINGGLYSLEGNIQKVTTDIFILAPKNVEIDGNLRDQMKEKGVFNW